MLAWHDFEDGPREDGTTSSARKFAMILFYFLVSVMPLTNHPLWSRFVGDFTVFKYLGAASLIYAFFHILVRRTFPAFFRTWQASLFLVLYLIGTWSYFTESVPTEWEFSPFLAYTCLLLLLFVTLSVVDTLQRLRCVLLVAIGSVAFGSLYVLREWQVYHDIYPGMRPGGVVGDPNYFALSAVLCLPIAFYMTLGHRPLWERAYCLGCLLLTLVAVTLGASRGGFIGLVVAFVYVLARTRRRVRNLVAVCAFLVPTSLLLPSSPVQRFLHPDYGDQLAVKAREVAWEAGLRMIEAHPLVGVGLGNYKPLMSRYADPGANVETVAHNTYVEIAAEMGLPSLLLFLGILFSSFRTLEEAHRRTLNTELSVFGQAALGIQAGLAGFAVASFFLSAEYQKLFWLMVFLSVCLPRLVSDSAKAVPVHEKG